jgi:hypothetical protein
LETQGVKPLPEHVQPAVVFMTLLESTGMVVACFTHPTAGVASMKKTG